MRACVRVCVCARARVCVCVPSSIVVVCGDWVRGVVARSFRHPGLVTTFGIINEPDETLLIMDLCPHMLSQWHSKNWDLPRRHRMAMVLWVLMND
jgi:hypothetical protein